MKNISPTILALAAVAPSIAALDVKDDDVKLGLTLQLQVRAERAWASDIYGNTYNVAGNAQDSSPQSVDMYLRRLRFGFKGSYQGDYKFAVQFRTDSADRANATAPASSDAAASRYPQIHVAYVERVFKQDELGLEHSVRAGLDYAFFNGASGVFSSSSFLLPSARVTENANFLAPRGVGVGYKLAGKAGSAAYTWGFDVQQNVGKDSTAAVGQNSDAATAPTPTSVQGSSGSGEGLCYTTRLQMVPFDSDAKGHMKPVESFVGAPGTGVMVSVEAGINRNNNVQSGTGATKPTTGESQNLKAYGIEALIHADAITALAEFRRAQLVTQYAGNNASYDTDRQSNAFIIQAGYCVPFGDMFLEPAFRWTRYDIDADNSEVANYNGTDYGTSGFQTELGLNLYINKHQNKLQLAFQNWRGEDGAAGAGGQTFAPAHANILRAQWQLSF